MVWGPGHQAACNKGHQTRSKHLDAKASTLEVKAYNPNPPTPALHTEPIYNICVFAFTITWCKHYPLQGIDHTSHSLVYFMSRRIFSSSSGTGIQTSEYYEACCGVRQSRRWQPGIMEMVMPMTAKMMLTMDTVTTGNNHHDGDGA